MQQLKSNIIRMVLAIVFSSIVLPANAFLDDFFSSRIHNLPGVELASKILSSEQTIGSIGLISCLSLGYGTTLLFNPTIVMGLGCGFGLFSLFSNKMLWQVLRTVRETKKEITDHRLEFQKHCEKTQENHKTTISKIGTVETKVDTGFSTVENNAKQRQQEMQQKMAVVIATIMISAKQLYDNQQNLKTYVKTEIDGLSTTIVNGNQQINTRFDTVENNVKQYYNKLQEDTNKLLDKQENLEKELRANQDKLDKLIGTQERYGQVQEDQGKDLKLLVQYIVPKPIEEERKCKNLGADGKKSPIISVKSSQAQTQSIDDDQVE